MSQVTPSERHPTDGDLIRLLDGAASAGSEEPLRRHLDGCPGCRERLARYRERGERLGAVLRAADPIVAEEFTAGGGRGTPNSEAEPRSGESPGAGDPTPEAGAAPGTERKDEPEGEGRKPWWQIRFLQVAALLALAAGLALVLPVQAWVAAGWRAAADALGGEVGSVPGQEAPAGSSVVSFPLDGRELLVRIEHPQETGSLAFRRAEDETQVTAEVTAGFRSESFLILPDGLGIENSPSSAASYRIRVPTGVRRARVRLGEREIADLRMQELGEEEERTIGLSGSDPLQ